MPRRHATWRGLLHWPAAHRRSIPNFSEGRADRRSTARRRRRMRRRQAHGCSTARPTPTTTAASTPWRVSRAATQRRHGAAVGVAIERDRHARHRGVAPAHRRRGRRPVRAPGRDNHGRLRRGRALASRRRSRSDSRPAGLPVRGGRAARPTGAASPDIRRPASRASRRRWRTPEGAPDFGPRRDRIPRRGPSPSARGRPSSP